MYTFVNVNVRKAVVSLKGKVLPSSMDNSIPTQIWPEVDQCLGLTNSK